MRFSATSAAAVTCAIMKPEFTPLSGARKAGRPLIFGSTSSATRRSAIEPISAHASARMSAAKATGSAWKLPPDSTSPVSREDQRIVGDRVGLGDERAPPAACIRSRHAPITCGWQRSEYGSCTRVAGAMRLADLAAREQLAVHLRDAGLAVVAAHVVDARIKRRVAALQGIKRQRAAHHRGREHGLELEQPGERQRGGDLRAVEQRETFLRARASAAPGPPARALRPRAGSRRRRRMCPRPSTDSDRCASGARSPEAPTEPCAGTHG